jgi:hypothetical protein
MSGERWVSPSQRMQRDPRRQALLDEYLTLGVHRAQWPSGARVTFGEYAEMRAEGKVERVRGGNKQSEIQGGGVTRWLSAARTDR